MNKYSHNQIITLADVPMPQTRALELQVIADILCDNGLFRSIEGRLTDELFSDDSCKRIFKEIRTRIADGGGVDTCSITSIVTTDYLGEISRCLISAAPTELTFASHIDALCTMAAKRRAYLKAIQILQTCTDSASGISELMEQTNNLRSVDALVSTQPTSVTLGDAIFNLGNEIAEAQQKRKNGEVIRIPTGLPSLDELLMGGFNYSELVILAARPSNGKTALMLQMAMAAATAGKATTIFSLEMSSQQLAQRLALATDKLSTANIAYDMNWTIWQELTDSMSKIPLYLNDAPMNIDELCSGIAIAHKRKQCDIVFIDYLGLIQSAKDFKGIKALELADMTSKLKRLAKQLKIPVVLLCQLNRNNASENRPPMLHDLRDSGAIEQDADIVLMLNKVCDEGKTILEIYVRKHRNGKANIVIATEPNATYSHFNELCVREA